MLCGSVELFIKCNAADSTSEQGEGNLLRLVPTVCAVHPLLMPKILSTPITMVAAIKQMR
jgi:hypothetical protein